jgi:hypothetical protein
MQKDVSIIIMNASKNINPVMIIKEMIKIYANQF